MKHLRIYMSVLTAILMAVCFSACQDEDEGKLAPWMEFTNDKGEEYPSSLSVDFSGGTYTLNIFTNTEWTITTDVEWMTANPSAKLGCTSGTLTVAVNETNETRTGTLTLATNCPELPVYTVTVTQAGAPKIQEAYFVTPDGKGEKTGADWENAMDVNGFADLLTNALDMSTYPIYMSEGTYTTLESPFKANKNIFHIYGGYSAQSTGTDLTQMADEPTVLSGNSTNPIFDIENYSIVFENITFANGFTATDQTGSGIHVSGSRAQTDVELINCVVRDCVSQANGQEGAAISLAGGQTKLNNVQILNNTAKNRGAGICTNGATEGDENDFYVFINNCTFSGNRLTEDWNWGTDINARRGYVCVNNSTFYGTETRGNNEGPVNADATLVMSNTTFIGNTNNNWLVRHNGSQANFVNCLFINNGASMSLSTGDVKNSLSGGWNMFQGIDFELSDTDTDASDFSFTGIDPNAGFYAWNVSGYAIQAFATQQDVINAVRNTNNIASEFVNWVGEANFALDQRGEARNPDKMQPGAYDENLN